MMPLQNTASKVVISPASLTSAGTASGWVDTLGYSEAAIDFLIGAQAATATNPVVLKLSEGDSTTAFTAITGLVGDATDGFVIPPTDTAASVVRMNLDLRKRKRYLSADFTAGNYLVGFGVCATLGKAEDSSVARAQMAAVVEL